MIKALLFGQILPKQSIGMLIETTFPRMMRVSKEDMIKSKRHPYAILVLFYP
jgi:hypothetical protein